MQFQLESTFQPSGDQPHAIAGLVDALHAGEKHATLMGVTGSGKSVIAHTPVFISQGTTQSIEQIGVFIDSLLTGYPQQIKRIHNHEFINTSDLPNGDSYQAYSFDSKTKQTSWKNITQVMRHVSPTQLFSIQTTCGRSVTVTGDHNFFVLRSGALELLETKDIQENDFIPVPLSLPQPPRPLQTISLLDYLPVDRTYISLPTFPSIWKEHARTVRPLLTSQKWYHLKQGTERITSAIYQQLVAVVPQLAENATLGTKSRRYSFPLFFSITDQFMRFLGYYVAEGHGSKQFTLISSGDQEVIEDFSQFLQIQNLQYHHRPNTYDYQIYSFVWTQLLKKWCGSHSQSKRLPSFWPSVSNHHVAQLLKGYFSGDGGVDGDKVTTTTASEELASDIQYALLRFGIVARKRKRHMRIPNTKKEGVYWTVRISGQHALHQYQQSIGFTVKKKQERLQQILHDRYNTNVDIIPLNGEWLRQMRQYLKLLQRDIAEDGGVTRSLISMIEDGKRMPSRQLAVQIFKTLEERARKENNTLLKDIQAQKELLGLYWTRVKAIEKIPGEGYVYDFSVKDNETFLAGSGGLFVHNTFSMANVIAHTQRPTLVISHNKTLAAQLASEFREFFPHSAVNYFVSYYDYYQPEAYIASSDTYIEKETQLNEEIDRLRHAAVQSVLTRRDVIIVASVSCIYGLGSPEEYKRSSVHITKGGLNRRQLLIKLVDMQFQRNDIDFFRGRFRVRGDSVEVYPTSSEHTALRFGFFGEELESIHEVDVLTGEVVNTFTEIDIFPATLYQAQTAHFEDALQQIRHDLDAELAALRARAKEFEAHRLEQRVKYDLEMIENTGFVGGIENYSRYFDGRAVGEAPFTLFDYFPKDYLLMIDESHQTIPQIGGMYAGDRSRKQQLVDYGFRMQSAFDNRPLRFAEFEQRMGQVIYVSATPGPYEKAHATTVVEQLIRPTGIVDPDVDVRPTKGQIPDLLREIQERASRKERVLVTTLTKRMAEELADFLNKNGVAVQYLHSEVETMERLEILRDLRLGKYDVLVGINLLREGLDLPEVSLVAILDADKEGFLRSETSLIQTMGRAARHVNGHVILYADTITGSMQRAMDEVQRRRAIQAAYNTQHGITPQSIQKKIRTDRLAGMKIEEAPPLLAEDILDALSQEEYTHLFTELQAQMTMAAQNLEFEKAAALRDQIAAMKEKRGNVFTKKRKRKR